MLHRVVLKAVGAGLRRKQARWGSQPLIISFAVIVGKPVIAARYSTLDRVVPRPL